MNKGNLLSYCYESFFRINARKVNALINSVNNDLKKANQACLRYADDAYRKVIFKSEMYVANGVFTEKKAIEKAIEDFEKQGIHCIEYADGSRRNIADYADMAIRTASQRAHLMGEGEMRRKIGETLIKISKHGGTCPLCAKWEGKVLIDDVYSNGTAEDGPYPLLSEAMAAGLYHPRCRHGCNTYYPEIEDIWVENETNKSKSKILKNDSDDDIIALKANSKSGRYYNPNDIQQAITQKDTNFVTKDINNPESLYGEFADLIEPLDGVYDIKAHGHTDSIKVFDSIIDAQELAKILMSRDDYNFEPIRLLCCDTGRMNNGTCFAQELADLLNVDVYAPNEELFIWSNGKLKNGESIITFKPRKYKK